MDLVKPAEILHHVARRLREGAEPEFPPSRADALLLGGTVFDLLAREEGERACVTLARGPHPDGPVRETISPRPMVATTPATGWAATLSATGWPREKASNVRRSMFVTRASNQTMSAASSGDGGGSTVGR